MEEDDIDIEGDFDLKPTALSDAGDDDLPSKSAHLQPEFSQHPWVLEQGWTLDNGIDEKSKAVIEKMLQEEQFYIDGKTTEVNVPVVSPTRPPNKPLSHKKQWTEEEKDMFFKGLEMFGHSWSKISSLIPTRSSQQVKYFAHQHLKQKTKSSLLMKPQSRISQSVHQMLLSVTTAQPTVASLMPKGKRAERKLNMPQKQRLPKSQLRKGERTKTNTTGGVTVSHSLEVIRINNVSEGSSDEEIDVIDTDDTDDTATGLTMVSGPDLGQSRHDLGDVDSRENHTDIGESGGIDKVNCDEIDTETQAEHDSVTKIYTRQCVGDDTSVGSDTTNKNQTCGETDCIVRTVSGTVDEIYPVAGFFSESNTSCATMDTLCGCSAEVHNVSHSHCYSVSDSEHFTEIDPLLSLSPCHEASVTCDDTVAGMTGCSGTTWVDPRLLVTEVEGGVSCLPDKTAGLIPGGVSDLGERGTQEQASTEQGEPDPCERRCCVQEKMHCDGVSDATAVSRETGNTEGVSEDDEEHLDEYAVVTSSGDAVYMANPTSEVKLDIEVIIEQEKLIHSEFFDNRPGLKTPDRYLRIRTFIIDSWRRCKPNYLTKTSVRPGLRNCGDVNCIGRIHSYLEQLGAINFGCSQVQYNRPVRAIPTKVTKDVTSDEQQQCVVAERLAIIHARKRRVRDEHGNWVDEGDLEGKTIQHDNILSGSQQTSKSTKVRRLYDPFLLVPCQRFSLTHPAPFHVVIEYSGLLTMDVHAHLSKTEVIGLLGGDYSSERGELHVTMAEPCDSISTGMQCEMDPVSQTEASDVIRSTGQAVVGWYHSHPTFAPNPSVRDLETQHKFQGWFAKGGSPFIGVIVNPYNKQTSSPQSQFRCLIVCSEEDISTSHTNTGVPYEFNFESSHRHWNDDTVITQVTRLTQTYSSYVNRVNLLQPMTSTRNFTFLEKIVQSVETYLPEEHRTDPDRSLMSALSNTMTQLFTNCDSL